MREPSDKPYVSLTEAITWIAYGDSQDHDAFKCLRNSGAAMFNNGSAFDERLRSAVQKFRDRASAALIKVRGRYCRDHSRLDDLAYADTRDISENSLCDYARFDIDYGGLRRGNGLTSDHQSFDATYSRLTSRSDEDAYHPDDGYYDVEVHRDDLMREFPNFSSPATRPGQEVVIAWCRKWIADGNGSGEGPAWNVFKTLAEFKGCSRDDVFRPAWRDAKTKQ